MNVKRFEQIYLKTCAGLYMDTFSKEPWNESWESPAVVEAFLQRHIDNNYFLGYVLEQDGEIIGASFGFTKPWIRGFEYYIDEFFISPAYQRNGAGTSFLDEIRKDLRAKGINAIMLLTEKQYPAYTFYMKNGFKDCETMRLLIKTSK